MFRERDSIRSTWLRRYSRNLGLSTFVALALVFFSVQPSTAQETLPVVGGKAVLTIVPETVTVVVPPPPWECPPGWTCTPPDIVEPPVGAIGDTSNAIAWWFADDYPSNESFKADMSGTSPEGVNAIYAKNLPELINLDQTEGYGELNSAARIDYIYDTYECNDEWGSGCSSQRPTFSIQGRRDLASASGDYREVWVEFSFKLSANNYGCSYNEAWGEKFLPMTAGEWSDDPDFYDMWTNQDPPCAYKFTQLNPRNDSNVTGWSRWIVIPASGGAIGPTSRTSLSVGWSEARRFTDAYDPDPETDFHCVPSSGDETCWHKLLTTYFFDNNWHRFRLHIKPSTTENSWDARYEVWIDDIKLVDNIRDGVEFQTREVGVWTRLALGANKDHGGVFPHTEWTKWSHAIVWVEKPAWYGGD